jgi:5-methylcytosine-specific restriction enzyme subunit McrC
MTSHTNKNHSSANLTSNGVPIRNVWHMLLYAWREHRVIGKWNAEVESAPTLDALLSRILAKLVHHRVRIGLGRGYRPHKATLQGIRGRVDFGVSLKQITFPAGKAHCRFQTFSPNVLKNQIIRSTLQLMAMRGEFGSTKSAARQLRRNLQILVRELDGIDLIDLSPEIVHRQQQQRDDHDYRLMLLICSLIVQHLMPMQSAGTNRLHQIDMSWKFVWRVFEEFVAKFYQLHLTGWQVWPQKRLLWPADDSTSFLPVMKPDIVMRHKGTGQIVIVDTKLTSKSLVIGQHGNSTFNRDHLFQLYGYVRSQADRGSDWNSATGMLLYPAVANSLSESVTVQGNVLRWETIDLTKPWQEIEEDLLQLMKHMEGIGNE